MYYTTYTVMVTPAWRYRIQRRSWLAAVPGGRPTAALARGRRPKTTTTDYGIKFGAAERRRGGGPQDAGGGRAVGVVRAQSRWGYLRSWPSMA